MKTSSVFKLLSMLAISQLTACTTPTIATTDDACLTWPYTDYSAAKDTPETVKGNQRNNSRRDAYCKGAKP